MRVDAVARVRGDVHREVARIRVQRLHGRRDIREWTVQRDGVAVAIAERQVLRTGDLRRVQMRVWRRDVRLENIQRERDP